MKTVKVAAAVIFNSRENPTQLFATARGYGESKGMWEFPGGKLEPGESGETACVREIREELSAEILPFELIDTVEHDYPAFHLSMQCYACVITGGELKLLEAESARWLNKDELYSVNWLSADLTLIPKLEKMLK